MKHRTCLHFSCAGAGTVMQSRSQISPTPRVAGVFGPDYLPPHQEGSGSHSALRRRDSLIRHFLKKAAFLKQNHVGGSVILGMET